MSVSIDRRTYPQIEALEDRYCMDVVLVRTAADTGANSLREAINLTNLLPGPDTIRFEIGDKATHTILVGEDVGGVGLNPITDTVIFETTPAGFADQVIVLSGKNAVMGTVGLTIDGLSSQIRGLTIVQFEGAGLMIRGNGNAFIEGCFIGTDRNGTAGIGNGVGVIIRDSGLTRIGSLGDAARNVISGNGNGIIIDAPGIAEDKVKSSDNVIINNFIGVHPNGKDRLANEATGIVVRDFASTNRIGGFPGEGNIISGNGGGIGLTAGAKNNEVIGNLIGLNIAEEVVGNTLVGVQISDRATNNFVAVSTISGNGVGVLIAADAGAQNHILGNKIGTNSNGTQSRPNKHAGVHISGSDAVVGGIGVSNRNVISGNDEYGVRIEDGSRNLVRGNYIGTGPDGATALANKNSGVYIELGDENTIGGALEGQGNVIAGNLENGVLIEGGPQGEGAGNLVLGNHIGVPISGVGNGKNGVRIVAASSNQIGGINKGESNRITLSGGAGVAVLGMAGIDNLISANAIYSNNGLGIDLSDDGVTVNDALDADQGPNTLQNYPVLSRATLFAAHITLEGTLHSTPNTVFVVSFSATTGEWQGMRKAKSIWVGTPSGRTLLPVT
jgi:hypothetical protein